ncbi:MAG: acetoin utilization protein AcuC [Firmicutes bacterium]|nr:acetoin utilization protein AcuC [Bacillota bacterium]
MSGSAVFLYTPAFLDYSFAPDHPFNPLRLELTVDLLAGSGLLERDEWVDPRSATVDELSQFHDPSYIQVVQEAGRLGYPPPGAARCELGTEDNPIFPGMHEAAARAAGASLAAGELVVEGKAAHALNLAGGLHHAHPYRASGFCIYNDAAILIRHLKRKYGIRVAYIDTDAHHGDGVQWAFYNDPEVLTISFHETGRYLFPGTGFVHERGREEGFGYSVNVPLEAFTEDASFIECFETVVPPLLRAFGPDLIVSQNGCDAHALDPLSHLSLTNTSFRRVPEVVHSLAHQLTGGRWIALGGGGYDIWRVVPRAWALLWSEVSGRLLPFRLPSAWLDRWQPRSPVPLASSFGDNPSDFPPVPRQAEIQEKNRITSEQALEEALRLIKG